MQIDRRKFTVLAGAAALRGWGQTSGKGSLAPNRGQSEALLPWKSGVRIKPVSTVPSRHSIHTYFNVTPESPDGRTVLFYASPIADGQTQGSLIVHDRHTGME